MRVTATPGEVAGWATQLAPLPHNRQGAVIRWLSEVLCDCRYCDGPVRRCDSRGYVGGGIVHLRCTPTSSLTVVQRDALADRGSA